MDRLPDKLLLKIYSNIDWRNRILLESLSKKWNRILLDRSLRMIGSANLNLLVKDTSMLPDIIRSLVAVKGKIIGELIISDPIDCDVVTSVMETITTVQPQYLKRLSRTVPIAVYPWVGLCINLEVLELAGVAGQISLFQSVHLKELSGQGVQYVDCRAPNLVKLTYENVTIHTEEDSADFRQMLLAAASSIEQLVLKGFRSDSVTIAKSGTTPPPLTCVLSKIQNLELIRTTVSGFIIDLIDSVDLEQIVISDCNYQHCIVVHFDLSVHCLAKFDSSCHEFNLVNQLVGSAIMHPERLGLLEDLSIGYLTFPVLGDLLQCISSVCTYSFRSILFYTAEIGDYVVVPLQLVSCLAMLVRCSPALASLDLSNFNIDEPCLLELVLPRLNNNNDVDLLIELGSVDTDSEINCWTNLFNQLSSIVTDSVVNCRCRIRVDSFWNISDDDREEGYDADTIYELDSMLKDKFGVCFI